ncbi:MAG: membrane protein insertase YidC [Candidatus Aminicenantes bacterium]|nr:membrane protein insertase YidC [Candidatus Aminicenantes bacterium]
MERRLILAIVLSFLVLFLYQLIFIKPAQKPESVMQKTPAAVTQPAATPAEEKSLETKPVAAFKEKEGMLSQVLEDTAERIIKVETPLYIAEWSNRGATLRSWKLKHHLKSLPTKEKPEPEWLDLVPETAAKTGLFPFSLKVETPELTEKINQVLYLVRGENLSLSQGETGTLIFEYSDGNSIKIRKELVFNGQDYNFKIRSTMEVGGREVKPIIIWGPGIGTLSPEELKQKFSANRGVAFLSQRNKKVYRVQEKKIGLENEAHRYLDLAWAAYEENYFASIFLLEPGDNQAFAYRIDLAEPQADGKTVVVPYYYLGLVNPVEVYLGPKEYDRLVAYGHQTKKIINFGFFGGVAELLLVATKFFHRYFPNWGVAIIIMTFIIKILFFPLTYSSTKSMARMQELQPKIKALRAKYKKAKQDMEQRRQMNEELMQLYKEHGINPASGCLPLLIQLPVFWGFFRMLVVAVEFRHSPFVFWIKDLSVRDPYYVTPILMGVTQYISQKMTPSTADPAQQKIMLLMPFIFTIFFMNFQAGLVLYWLTNNVLQIAQQAIMNKMMAAKREKDGKRKKK